MYNYTWTNKNGIFKLGISGSADKELRPVYKEELDFFGFNEYWTYPDTDKPLLWAENIRRYVINGELVAEATGGGFYTKPTIKFHRKDIELSPIDTVALWDENADLMMGLMQTAILFIRKNRKKFAKQGYHSVCAFSGGKDSLVLLDLMSKALSPDQFYVIFGDTGMELSATYKAVNEARERYANLRFHEAKSHMSPEKSWEEFGPPGRRMRWCCSVHKSVPTVLKMREIAENYNARVLVFDGVRAEESAQRSEYEDVSIGAKSANQVNCSPLFKWNSAEVFLHLIASDLLFNKAYRQGLYRVGCMICPMSSEWWDGISNSFYREELKPLLNKVEKYAANTKPMKEAAKFVESGGWKARMGGKGLEIGGNRITEMVGNDTLTFMLTQASQQWDTVAHILGKTVSKNGDSFSQLIDGKTFHYDITTKENGSCHISYRPYSAMDRFLVSRLRGVANKVAYCRGCKACEVQCPKGAYIIDGNGSIFIRESECNHCGKCISFSGKGCLIAKSLSITGGSYMDLKGINRYQHFGLRKLFSNHFFDLRSECFASRKLGNRQYDALKVWLRDALLLSAANKGEKVGQPTELFDKIVDVGLTAEDYLTWAIIWTNLAYNSKIVRWYMLYAPVGETYEKGELVYMLGDEYSQSTRDNAVTSLVETFRESPIGEVLKQGIPIKIGSTQKYAKFGWEQPDSVAILYSLYRFAEETGHYSFSLSKLEEMRNSKEAKGMDPVTIFGLDPDGFKDILKELSIHYEDYIKVSFQAGLDGIRLFENIKSPNVLEQARV